MDYFEAGLGPISEGSPGASSLVAFPVLQYQTPVLDLTVPNLGIEIIPAKPNHVPFLTGSVWIITAVSGTQTVPLVAQAGNNAAHSNIFPSNATSPSNADVNSAAVPSLGTGYSNAISTALLTNTPAIFDVTSGAQGTGGFILRGRLYVAVIWIAVRQ